MTFTKALDWLLTREAEQRLRLVNAGLALIMMILAAAVMHLWRWLGVVDGVGLWPWTVASVGGLAAMFLASRFGWTRHFADPFSRVAAFAVRNRFGRGRLPSRRASTRCIAAAGSASLMFGTVGLPRGRAGWVAVYTIGVFGIAMCSGAMARPSIYDPRAQVGYFIAFAVFVSGFVAVNERIATIRRRVHVQKSALAEALERIHALATRDELTGLLNRRAMGDLLNAELQRTDGTPVPWCLAILDVDHFKHINDQYGHAAGDEALRVVGGVCAGMVRSRDSVARWGGEEFVVIVREAGLHSAAAAAERIRAALEGTPVSFDGATIHLTVSIGVAVHLPAEDIATTLARADRSLYQAKAGGRNRVVAG